MCIHFDAEHACCMYGVNCIHIRTYVRMYICMCKYVHTYICRYNLCIYVCMPAGGIWANFQIDEFLEKSQVIVSLLRDNGLYHNSLCVAQEVRGGECTHPCVSVCVVYVCLYMLQSCTVCLYMLCPCAVCLYMLWLPSTHSFAYFAFTFMYCSAVHTSDMYCAWSHTLPWSMQTLHTLDHHLPESEDLTLLKGKGQELIDSIIRSLTEAVSAPVSTGVTVCTIHVLYVVTSCVHA